MKLFIRFFGVLLLLIALQGPVSSVSFAAEGNLTVYVISTDFFFDKAPGDSLKYVIYYYWFGDGPASNVQITNIIPNELQSVSASVQPTSTSGGVYTWNLGTIENYTYGTIEIGGILQNNIPVGTTLINSVTISGDVSDTDPEDNTHEYEIKISSPDPDLWVWKFGELEEDSENGFFFMTEQGVPTNYNIFYFNMSSHEASGVTVTDTLPEGTEFISADVQPSSVNGRVITWNIGNLKFYDYGQIKTKVKPTLAGTFTNRVYISSSGSDKDPSNNSSSYQYQVVSLLQPKVLKPAVGVFGSSDTLIMGSNPTIQGLAKAGSTVTLYEGSPDGSFSFEGLNAVSLGSAVAGPDRRWSIKPTNMTEGRNYFLYVRAEKDGESSNPFFNYWQPFIIKVEPMFELAGFDPDNFVVESAGHEVRPGALGTTSGTTPNEDIIIKKRQKAPASFLTDTNMWKNHTMKAVVTENGQTDTLELPISEVNVVSAAKNNGTANDHVTYEIIYVQKGFGPGAVVEIWCRPTYYTDEGHPIAGLVFVKCHEILIDPAGYVYEAQPNGTKYEWPEVPPEELLIKNATVTTMTRTGDDSWEVWDGSGSAQVNPQVTDETTNDRILVPGYFAFYVPSGQYQVRATADGYAEYVSPILTVVDEPVFHNCGMTPISGLTGVKFDYKETEKPAIYTLDQNYPNPFNPVTTMSYTLPVDSKVSLKIYDIQGREVAILINSDMRPAGKHVLQFDGSGLSSGIYFYVLTANNFTAAKKFVLLK